MTDEKDLKQTGKLIEADFYTYQMVIIEGKAQVAARVNGKWQMTDTCRDINEMLDAGLVCEDTVQGWIDVKKRNKKN